MNEEKINIVRLVLKKLYKDSCWGKGHMLVERLKRVVPTHLRGDVAPVIEELAKDGIIVVYGKTKYGLAVNLNIAKKREIEEILFGNQNV